jgi:hypothetical protein
VCREANEAVHRLAKGATTDVNDRIWRDAPPRCISAGPIQWLGHLGHHLGPPTNEAYNVF